MELFKNISRLITKIITSINVYANKINIKKPFSISKDTELNGKTGIMVIGSHLRTMTNVHLVATAGGKLDVGDNVFFNRNCIVVARGETRIGSHTVFGPNVCVYDHDHLFDSNGIYPTIKAGKITIGDNCWLGAGAIILRNTEIGEGSIVGAGTVVKGVIPPHSIVTNNRGLLIRKIDDSEKQRD